MRIEGVMSSKNRTRKTSATNATGSTRPLRSVPNQDTTAKVRTDTEDKLWTALLANPHSTAADLASAAKIGKSTAAKILVKWHKDGSVARTPGIAEGGRRVADLWTLTDTDTDVDTDSTEHTPAGDVPVDNADSVDTEQVDATAPELTDAETADDGGLTEPTGTAADHAPDATDTGATDPAKAEPGVAESTRPAVDSAATDGGTATKASGDGKKTRLAPGALRGMVEDHLRDHPGEAFGPTAIATALGGKSSGAVSNALDKLVDAGTAVQTQESPRRFALAPAERSAAASTATK
jgi:hypothetical protein